MTSSNKQICDTDHVDNFVLAFIEAHRLVNSQIILDDINLQVLHKLIF